MKPKTNAEIDAMREGGQLLATILRDLKKQALAGVSELELDAWVAREITGYGAEATYHTSEVNFPGVICISVNDAVVHSIPTEYVLRPGDVASFDLVIGWKGMKTDSAFSMVIGDQMTPDTKRLLETTERSLYAGIDAITGPVRIGDISAAIEVVLTAGKLGIVRELVGHGIGHSMHEAPDVPNYGRAGSGPLLSVGDTIAIEPMATLGKASIYTDRDGWTISTRDGSRAAHFEHTVMVLDDGVEILTKL
ncbi:MAG TPA: type I methionyl aminopeptidase [Candidatus Saccharimonadales bacterium]|jgi:methionyl aminopeptidase